MTRSGCSGFTATPEEILQRSRAYVAEKKDQLAAKGWANFGKATGEARSRDDLRWVSMLDLKQALETVFEEAFGKKPDPKEAAAKAAAEAKAKKVFRRHHYPSRHFLIILNSLRSNKKQPTLKRSPSGEPQTRQRTCLRTAGCQSCTNPVETLKCTRSAWTSI